jgi:hypothetical protein
VLGLAGFVFHEPTDDTDATNQRCTRQLRLPPKIWTGSSRNKKRPRAVPRAFEREEFDKRLFQRNVVRPKLVLDACSDIELVHVDIDAVSWRE